MVSRTDIGTDDYSIKITIEQGESQEKEYLFRNSFKIGRDESCQLRLENSGISRFHAEVFIEHGVWWIRDLGSTNGTFINGEKIDKVPLEKNKTVEFGLAAAILSFQPEESSPQNVTKNNQSLPSLTGYIKHYFEDTAQQNVGMHTRMIRDAFQRVQKKQKSYYIIIISFIGLLLIGAAIYGVHKHRQVQRLQLLAEEIFYEMKKNEVDLAERHKEAENSQNAAALHQIQIDRIRQKEMSEKYDNYLRELHVYDDGNLDEIDQLILRVARVFGECELSMPKDFVAEVRKYIKKWQSTDRLEKAINRANEHGFTNTISETMLKYDLPPQYFYLALQESDYRIRAVGPPTRYGFAKGIWQFIPATALKFGLRTGPLVEINQYDPRDDRFNFEKATDAAAQYIRHIYESDAQASGLLVIASYNWGERKIASLIQKMPADPRERNFWKLLKNHRRHFPLETYNYVFYIISAAVIGENPKLFGFKFENPLLIVN